MIFVDTNVFIYAVGGAHPLRDEARAFLRDAVADEAPLATSAEVLQELLHAYLRVGRFEQLAAAWELATQLAMVWPVEPEDVDDARRLADRHPTLDARDLVHLACCQRRQVHDLKTYDKRLAEAWAA